MDTQFDSLMSSGTPNCWTMCPWGHVTILLAVPSGQGPCWLCVPYSWPWLTRQALLREPAGRHVSPGQRALGRGRVLEATGWATLWRRVQLRSTCLSRGTRPPLRRLDLTGSPHQPRRGQRQRLGRFLRVSSVSPSIFAGRCAEQGALKKCLRRLGRGPAGP